MLELLASIGYYAIIAVVGLVGLAILSALKPFIKPLFDELNGKLKFIRNQTFDMGSRIYTRFTEPMFEKYKNDLQKEDQALFRAKLQENRMVKKMTRVSKRFDAKLHQALEKLKNSGEDINGKVDKLEFPDLEAMRKEFARLDLEQIQEDAKKQRRSSVFFWIYLVVTLAIISVNTFLMNEFWHSMAPGFRSIIPFLGITYAMLLAFFFAVIEVGAGVVHYGVEEREDDEEHKPFHTAIRMFVIFVVGTLALTELAAFAKISSNIGFAEQMGIAATSPLYNFVDYFLAPFGPAITLMLFALGYKVIDSFFTWRAYRQKMAPIRRLIRTRKELEKQQKTMEDVCKTMQHNSEEMRDVSAALNSHIENPEDEDFRNSTKGEVVTAIARIHDYYGEKKEALTGDLEVSDLKATRYLMVAGSLGLAWLVFLHLTAITLTRTFDAIEFPLNNIIFYDLFGRVSIFSFLLALFIGIAGYLLKKQITGEEFATDEDEKARPVTQYVNITLITLVMLSGLALVGLSLYNDTSATSFSWLASLFLIVALYITGIRLDDYLTVLNVAGRYFFVGLIALGCFILGLIVALVWVAMAVVFYLYDFITKPGDWIRSAFTRKEKDPIEKTPVVVD